MERFVFDLNNRTSHHNPLKSKGFTSKRTDLIKQRFVLCPIIALMWGGAPFTFIPMATSGCGNLNPTFEAKRNPNNKIQVLRNRKVVLFPDAGKFNEWKAQGEKLKGFCQEVYISTVMERNLHPHKVDCEINDGDGFDDCILRYVADGKEIWNLICTCYGYHGQWKIV